MHTIRRIFNVVKCQSVLLRLTINIPCFNIRVTSNICLVNQYFLPPEFKEPCCKLQTVFSTLIYDESWIVVEKTRCRNLQYGQEKTRLVRCLLYHLEIELNWKAHGKVKWSILQNKD